MIGMSIIPSINWMMGFKILAYLSSVGFIWLLCREYIEDQQKAIFFSLLGNMPHILERIRV